MTTILPAAQFATEGEPQSALPDWLRLLAPGATLYALGALAFADAVVLLAFFGIVGEQRDLALYIIGSLLLAPFCAGMQTFLIRPDFRRTTANGAETINAWAAAGLLFALAAIPLLIYGGEQSAEFWFENATRVVIAVALLQIAAFLLVLPRWRRHGAVVAGRLCSRTMQVIALVLAAFAAGVALFWIDPSNRQLNLFVRLFVVPPFSDEPGQFRLYQAFTLAVLGIAAVAALGFLQAALASQAKALRTTMVAALGAAVVAPVLLFFDFSLGNDVFHYMTNVGPALHLLHGGTLMVDTFSQYGPGPVLMTLLGFEIGPITFGTAQLTVQLNNFLYYGLWLICLFRMTRWKLPGLLLGLFAIALFLAAWGRGYGNVNEAPSILALRHLPTLLMVVALSCLPYPKRHSAFAALSTFISSQWSVESLVGTLGVHLIFLGLLGLRDRNLPRLVVDAVGAVAPAIAGIAAMTILTLLTGGALPNFGYYLQFLTTYNPLAESWSVVANPLFFGWLSMLLAVFLVFGDAWVRVLTRSGRIADVDDNVLFYRFVPMATLLMIQAAYFAGRSVDYTLVIPVLSFCAIAIPAVLRVTTDFIAAKWPVKAMALIPLAVGVWALTFTFVSLFRQDSPYSLLVQECRDLGRCTPAALARGLGETIRVRGVLDHLRRPIMDGWYDNDDIVRDALAMIHQWAPDAPLVTVLLGRFHLDHAANEATEIALMYAGKWNRWPRSSTASDELIKPLAERIVAAPVRLQEGEVVIVRRNEAALGFIETGILRHIRSETILCRLPDSSKQVVAYRVAGGAAGCASE